MVSKGTSVWLSRRFGIPEEDIVFYNAGICYSRIVVKTEESAQAVSKKVNGEAVNGGMLDAMPLGGISKFRNEAHGVVYEVMV